MEESVFHQEKFWKELLAPSGILTQLKSLMSALPVKAAQCLVSQTSFVQENQKTNAQNAPTSMSETQRVDKFVGEIFYSTSISKATQDLGGWYSDFNRKIIL